VPGKASQRAGAGRSARYPAIDSAPVIANLVLLTTNCLDEVKVLRSSHFAQHDCADVQIMFANRLHGDQLTRVFPAMLLPRG